MITIEISTTELKKDDWVDGIDNRYYFYVTDIFNRLWQYTKNDGIFNSYEDAQKFEMVVKSKGYFEPEYYWIYSEGDEFFGTKFDSLEEVIYVRSSEDSQYVDNCWRLFVTTEGGFYYEHEKKFKDYKQLVDLAIKIKKKGIVDLKYWECRGSDELENWKTNIKELQKEEYGYYEDYFDPEEAEDKRILKQIEDDTIDGIVPGFR